MKSLKKTKVCYCSAANIASISLKKEDLTSQEGDVQQVRSMIVQEGKGGGDTYGSPKENLNAGETREESISRSGQVAFRPIGVR